PTFFTLIWFAVFGGSALDLELNQGADLAAVAGEDASLALFAFFEHYPLAGLLAFVAIILLVVFFVTSASSAMVVLGSLTSGGSLIVPMYKKVIWGVSLSAVAIILLVTGGLSSLQMMAITAAFPFMLVMLVLC